MLSHTTMRDVTVRVHSNTQGYRPASRRGGRRRAASNQLSARRDRPAGSDDDGRTGIGPMSDDTGMQAGHSGVVS